MSQGVTMEQTGKLVLLGNLLGQNQAFGMIAGRCTPAQAAAFRRLREEKLYKHCTPHWNDFCANYLKISKTQADHTIRLLEEFGNGYFELSQIMRISPETYRAIGPAVKGGALHFKGEAIAFDEGNVQKLAAALAELRRITTPTKSTSTPSVPAHLKNTSSTC